METPSSIRRVTRSQALAASKIKNSSLSKMIEDSEKDFSKSRQRSGTHQERTALIDVTNDSPIIGLAAGNLETPLSSVVKQRSSRAKNTPGSGEAILRSQVKTLLQKVEEEAELSKTSLENRPFLHLKDFVNSPMGFLAPTPVNTPQINLHEDGTLNDSTSVGSAIPSPFIEEQVIPEVVSDTVDGVNSNMLESQNCLLNRSLLQDFTEKSGASDSSECSSILTYQGAILGGTESKENLEDDDASIWSIQGNASTHDGEEEEVVDQEEEEDDDEIAEKENDEAEGLVGELCVGISKISMNENAVKFEGKHTRFVYNSDDELVEEQLCGQDQNEAVDCVSPNVLRLKGLPTPRGKHLRFHLEMEE